MVTTNHAQWVKAVSTGNNKEHGVSGVSGVGGAKVVVSSRGKQIVVSCCRCCCTRKNSMNLLIGAAVPTVPFDVSSERLNLKTGPYFGKGLNVFIRVGGHFIASVVQQDAAIAVQLP